MRALTWQGRRDVRIDDVPDPILQHPTDAIVRITSSAICGSDLHLYEVLGPFLTPADVLGHEPMGIVEEVGAEVTHIAPGDRVVIPFNISCGSCWMCSRGLFAQCETTQVKEQGKGASLFGYTSLYGSVPGGQAEYLRVPQAHFGPIKVPEGSPDEQYLFLSDVLPTAWQAVQYADVEPGGTVAVRGLGPIGQMATRIGRHLGAGRVRQMGGPGDEDDPGAEPRQRGGRREPRRRAGPAHARASCHPAARRGSARSSPWLAVRASRRAPPRRARGRPPPARPGGTVKVAGDQPCHRPVELCP